uniref:NADH-ubiquinone oxidoreductase chain 4L n=1 Tax=Bathymodiolus aduloides TaxID=268473 RepID=A0A8A2F1J0_9BIVA|nr:NADH dehydrogenase subunit 4L [Bathymodiolus aduloides]QSV10332.1 NADH dehydrogenase subunit 4L [Bathymodiolus aduloides]
MVLLMLLFSFLIFIFGVSLMCVRSMHLITVFLGMEFAALGVFSVVGSLSAHNSLFVLLVIICISVSEAAIMLSLMVMMTRMYGNDRCMSLMTDKS